VGKLPASQANGEVVSAYRREEKEKMKKLLRTYCNICFKAKVGSIFMSYTSRRIVSMLWSFVWDYLRPGRGWKSLSNASYDQMH